MQESPTIKKPIDPDRGTSRKFILLLALLGVAYWLAEHDDLFVRQLPILALFVIVSYYFIFMTWHQTIRRKSYRMLIDELKSRDNLTGLSNRQLFLSSIHGRLKSAQFQNKPFALLLVDIDRFKELDTILGTENGDLLLQEFANRLQHFQKRKEFVARLSGNEFAIVIEELGTSKTFEQRIQILHSYLKQPYRFHGRPIDITVSGGYIKFPSHGYRISNLLQQAKLALLRAKQDGRDQICCFEQRQDVRAHIDHELSQEMGKSIALGEFKLHFQPQCSIKTGKQTGFEALMRWDHPTRGWVSPGTFIQIAERNGLILPLSEFALREACQTAANWKQPLRVAVNLSPIQFKKTDLVQTVERILKETGLPAQRLELEVTESLFIQTSQRTIETLKQLRSMGITVALDDFGTGYSSLSYLSSFPIDKIKIDRSFVRDLAHNNGNMAIISAMIGIGRSLDIEILAEGIEDKETLEMLRVAGCHEAQGYYLGRPRDLQSEPGFEMSEPEHDSDPEARKKLKLIRNPSMCA
ncbi:bifunctional diguanylate cyclase/phosphodiesterase [uncultured Cohaesibacter sp.]|uniref:putative bifunctional diguanylate cyclase/phosphodiesterase n=1 Tax=uncultured Cohaesibacter sp. TaxID=1002546 RepID=UPI00292FCAE5|nr:bifunctional diguanylate cyclase/phosphodiesterase [uncultured Cohaesibacter sp.]